MRSDSPGSMARRTLANRRNALKSTGPNSEKGKAISSRNASKHGLAASTSPSATERAELNELAVALAGKLPEAESSVFAAIAADATLELRRVSELRTGLMQRVAKSAASISKRVALPKMLDQIAALERYERRAFSRRKKALRRL